MHKNFSLSAGLFFLLAMKGAAAGSFSISDIRIDLENDGTAETVEIISQDTRPMGIKIIALPWGVRPDEAEPVQNLIVVPPIFELPAGESQIIRLASRGLQNETVEKAFVLEIKEVPNEAFAKPGELGFTMNLRVPIFVSPEGAEPSAAWGFESTDTGDVELVLTNAGEAHLNVRSINLRAVEDDFDFKIEGGGFVLPGASKRWPVDTAIDRLKGQVILTAETDVGPLEAALGLPTQ